MKKILFIIALAIATTYSTSVMAESDKKRDKRAAEEQAAPARVARVARQLDPCEELAYAPTKNLRAFGTAKSMVERVARNEAIRDARYQLAQMMKVAIDGAAKDFAENANVDAETSTTSGSTSAATQYFMQNIASSRVIKWSIYDLSDGSIEVCVCVELLQDEDKAKQELLDLLNQDDVMNSKEDRDRYVAQIMANVEDYRSQFRVQYE